MKERWKRLLAFAIDWNLVLLPAVAAGALLASRKSVAWGFLLVPLMIGTIALVVLRDRIFNGASPGKRMMHLRVYDKKTLAPATAGACTVHNLFFFLLPLEAVILLATGETLGDRAAGTVVLSQTSLTEYEKAGEEGRRPGNKLKGKHMALIAGVMVLWILCGVFFVQKELQRKKSTEEYALAYAYLLQSDAWAQLDAQESDIRLTRYNIQTTHIYPADEVIKTAQLVFRAEGKNFLVVCQWKDGAWQVTAASEDFQ